IAAMLEQTADTIENQVIGKLETALDQWKGRVLLYDGILLGLLVIAAGVGLAVTDSWHLIQNCITGITAGEAAPIIATALFLGIAGYIHFSIRRNVARSILKQLPEEIRRDHTAARQFSRAFSKSTAGYRPLFLKKP